MGTLTHRFKPAPDSMYRGYWRHIENFSFLLSSFDIYDMHTLHYCVRKGNFSVELISACKFYSGLDGGLPRKHSAIVSAGSSERYVSFFPVFILSEH